MTVYSSTPPRRFAQISPKKTCPYASWHIVQSLHLGYEVRCWRPRCCFEGMDNWSYKNRLCETRLIDYLPEDAEVFRGSLTMPKNSNPDQHVKVRREFLRTLNRWKSKHEYTVEMRGLLHITDPLNAHWDILAYSNAPEKPLKAAVADAWHRAGGRWRGWSLEPCEQEELTATLKYQNKDTVNPDTARRYLPETEKNMGMKFIWHTRPTKTRKGFWQGQSEGALWREWLAEWYGDDRGSKCGTAPILDNMFRANQVSKLRALTPYADEYLRAFPWYTPEGSQVIAEGADEVLLGLVA